MENGHVNYSTVNYNGGYPIDTTALFTCDYGYSLSGSDSSICQTSTDWNEQPPTCNLGKN